MHHTATRRQNLLSRKANPKTDVPRDQLRFIAVARARDGVANSNPYRQSIHGARASGLTAPRWVWLDADIYGPSMTSACLVFSGRPEQPIEVPDAQASGKDIIGLLSVHVDGFAGRNEDKQRK